MKRDAAASVKLKIEPAAYILNLEVFLDFLTSSSSGSTKAPGRTANNNNPMDLMRTPSVLAVYRDQIHVSRSLWLNR